MRFTKLKSMMRRLPAAALCAALCVSHVSAYSDTAKALDEMLWLIHTMMDGGYRYAKHEGIDTPEPPALDDLQDICDVSDFAGLRDKINETITSGATPDVAVEDSPKNAGNTQTENP